MSQPKLLIMAFRQTFNRIKHFFRRIKVRIPQTEVKDFICAILRLELCALFKHFSNDTSSLARHCFFDIR